MRKVTWLINNENLNTFLHLIVEMIAKEIDTSRFNSYSSS